MNDDIIFAIHSNMSAEATKLREGKNDPHAWISIKINGETQTYGLWSKTAEGLKEHGGKENGWNGSGTDVQKDVEKNMRLEAKTTKEWKISKEQHQKFMNILEKSEKFSLRENNCAMWVANVANQLNVTKEKISSGHLEALPSYDGKKTLVHTPKGISQSIEKIKQSEKSQSQDLSKSPEKKKNWVMGKATAAVKKISPAAKKRVDERRARDAVQRQRSRNNDKDNDGDQTL